MCYILCILYLCYEACRSVRGESSHFVLWGLNWPAHSSFSHTQCSKWTRPSGYDQVMHAVAQDNAIAKTSSGVPPCVFLIPTVLSCLNQTDSCSFTFSVISTSEFDHKLGSHVKGKKHPPRADVTPNYNWCFSMDLNQHVALQTLHMDSMRRATTVSVTANRFQSSNFMTNAVPVDDLTLIAYNCPCCFIRLDVKPQAFVNSLYHCPQHSGCHRNMRKFQSPWSFRLENTP